MSGPARQQGRRVVVTGLGAVSACGWGCGNLWRGLLSGLSAIAPARRLDTTGQRTHLAAEVPEPPPEPAGEHPGWARLSRADRFAVAAATEAAEQAEISGVQHLAGVFFGTSTAGMAETEEFFARLLDRGKGPLRLSLLRSHDMNAPGDAVARRLGATGPVHSVSTACSSGAMAIATALEWLRHGDLDLAIAGGADSLCRLTYSGFNSLRAIDEAPCRPFRRERAGLSLGEGAGVLVLEDLEHARRRGARILAELLGAGASCDANHMTAPEPRGQGAVLSMRRALADAGVEAEAVCFVNAHGTGTPLNDASEACALREVFGPRASALPVTATKGVVGHLLGASGAIEAVATLLCLGERSLHSTPGPETCDPELGLDLIVGPPRPLPARCVAMSTSYGFGGANVTLVFAPCSAGALA